ncbi:hypothetical protein [Pseudomonas fluorescens]|uniref:hypothetical protein n=1 Tax=Pseudomonas fluorescens TaxID=294 RepID=UPI001397A676|nr:hypothetical protein [Pseudomonas fluorescens]QIA03172.1 hypothetical protein GZH78_13780 [Pseudomonas fluorescens]
MPDLIKDDKNNEKRQFGTASKGRIAVAGHSPARREFARRRHHRADSGARSREVIQQQVVALIDGFLTRSTQN